MFIDIHSHAFRITRRSTNSAPPSSLYAAMTDESRYGGAAAGSQPGIYLPQAVEDIIG